jgi:hypothetical protein
MPANASLKIVTLSLEVADLRELFAGSNAAQLIELAEAAESQAVVLCERAKDDEATFDEASVILTRAANVGQLGRLLRAMAKKAPK